MYSGFQAGHNNNGNNNVFIGKDAGYNETSATDKLIIHNTSTTASALLYGDFSTGQLGIGTNSLGTFALSVNGDAFATGMWTSSDGRFKQDQKVITGALEKVNKLSGVSYRFNQSVTASRKVSEGTQLGFIAQEVREVFPELVQEDGRGYLAVNYQGMVPVLLEAVKELSAEVASLKAALKEAQATARPLNLAGARLSQNSPNPFGTNTRVAYETEEGKQATLYLFDYQGHQVAVYPELAPGRGEVTIEGGTLQPGIYYYTLVVEGRQVETKTMILTR